MTEKYHTTASALARILGEDKRYWERLLFHDDLAEVYGYPHEEGGTAWTGEMRIIAAINAWLEPHTALELGTLGGASLRAARALHTPERHLAFDFNPACSQVPEGVEFFLTDWRHVGSLLPDDLKWQFLFLDCEHTAEAVLGEMEILAPYADRRAVAVVHDCDPTTTEGLTDGQGAALFATRSDTQWKCPLCGREWTQQWGIRYGGAAICKECGPRLTTGHRPVGKKQWKLSLLDTPVGLGILTKEWWV